MNRRLLLDDADYSLYTTTQDLIRYSSKLKSEGEAHKMKLLAHDLEGLLWRHSIEPDTRNSEDFYDIENMENKPLSYYAALIQLLAHREANTKLRESNYTLENYVAVFRMALDRIALMDDPQAMRKLARETSELTYKGISDHLGDWSK